MQSDRGYTLMETVVALGIFLGVLIPVGVCIGNLMIDRKPELTRRALLEAESLMNTTVLDRDSTSTVVTSGSDLQLERKILVGGETMEVRVLVFAGTDRRDTLVYLTRTVVSEPEPRPPRIP